MFFSVVSLLRRSWNTIR